MRRSRRRYWKSEHDADKDVAYATLYHVMVKLARLLAPFIPFMTEVMYQNLVRSVRPQAYESVHHTAWPQADSAVQDESLLEQMALARAIASLGLSARNAAGLKVRQPLSRVLVYAGGQRRLRDELVEIVTDELNVKSFEFVEQASRLVTYRVMPDNKSLGPRFGALFPKVRSALSALDPARVAESVAAGVPLAVEVDGQTVDLAPNEIIVTTQPAEGLAVASDKLATVAVDATLTPELKAEGLAREVVRRIQAMRKRSRLRHRRPHHHLLPVRQRAGSRLCAVAGLHHVRDSHHTPGHGSSPRAGLQRGAQPRRAGAHPGRLAQLIEKEGAD